MGELGALLAVEGTDLRGCCLVLSTATVGPAMIAVCVTFFLLPHLPLPSSLHPSKALHSTSHRRRLSCRRRLHFIYAPACVDVVTHTPRARGGGQ